MGDYILFRRGACDVTVRKTHGSMPFGILGMGFLRGHQILYDMDKKQVGIAPAKIDFNQFQESSVFVPLNPKSTVVILLALVLATPSLVTFLPYRRNSDDIINLEEAYEHFEAHNEKVQSSQITILTDDSKDEFNEVG